MSALLERLDAHKPALWLEVAPPRGIAVESMLTRLAALRGQVDAINLADNALGRVKLAPLVFGSMIKSRLGMAVVINFSCRDRNRYALKADLLGAGALGIDAVVALAGDKLADDPNGVQPVRDLDTFSLLGTMNDLRRGETGEGRRLLKTLPQFTIGAVANPNRKAIEREFELLERKAAAGAEFVITQPVFDSRRGANLHRPRASPQAPRRARYPAGQARIDGQLPEGSHPRPCRRPRTLRPLRRNGRRRGAAACRSTRASR